MGQGGDQPPDPMGRQLIRVRGLRAKPLTPERSFSCVICVQPVLALSITTAAHPETRAGTATPRPREEGAYFDQRTHRPISLAKDEAKKVLAPMPSPFEMMLQLMEEDVGVSDRDDRFPLRGYSSR